MLSDLAADSAFGLYRLIGRLAAPWAGAALRRRAARGREDPARLGERLGHAARPRPPGPLLWVHAASVGESLSVLPLVEHWRATRPDLDLLITTGTVTSARLMAERLPEGAIHHYAPLDLPSAVERFLDHWRPDAGVFVESELWPTLLTTAWRRGVRLILVNGRVSPRSLRSWRRARPLAARLLDRFSLVLAQTPEDAERLRALGAHEPRYLGNLKLAASAPPANEAELADLGAALSGRPRWLAASTHPGEETIAAEAHEALAPRFPGLLTLIVPRHPGRGAGIAADLAARGLGVARRGAGEVPGPAHDVYLADTIGELGLFYRLCEVAFVGGSLVPKGGQNLLEPARLGCAVLAGPHCDNFAAIAEEMAARGALIRVGDAAALAAAVAGLLGDPARREAVRAATRACIEGQARVLDAIAAAVEPHLPQVRR